MQRVFQECAMKEANDTSGLPTSIRTDKGELEHIRKQEEILKPEIEKLKVRDTRTSEREIKLGGFPFDTSESGQNRCNLYY